ncbi:hypothetical protein F4778DRAFT_784333 [Xylariomycetidae sp. FL2044]|nr:hypothetical protein F4778DRAFT_794874 [Xylariomycetidae sp. FL2044]KAH9893846.1 hypothetical protein F4778DRAFT_784333 [Xylariomycetidae sp. FL2044]
MSILYCCLRRRVTAGSPNELPHLPPVPPPAELSKTTYTEPDFDIPPDPIATFPASTNSDTTMERLTVDPSKLVAEDSEGEDDSKQKTKSSAGGTMAALKTKLIRRLSQRSESKCASLNSLGTTEEEIARRAQLRHSRNKRIQDELRHESMVGKIHPKAPNKPNPVVSCHDWGHAGPRDVIEFTVFEADQLGAATPSRASRESASFYFCGDQHKVLRPRSSCSKSLSRSKESSNSKAGSVTLRQRESMPQFPPRGHLPPVRTLSSPGSRSSRSLLPYLAVPSSNHLGIREEPEEQESLPQISGGPVSVVKKATREDEQTAQQKSSDSRLNVITYPCAMNDSIPPQEREVSKDLANAQRRNSSGNEPDTQFYDTSIGRNSPLDLWVRSQDLQSNSVPEENSPDARLHFAGTNTRPGHGTLESRQDENSKLSDTNELAPESNGQKLNGSDMPNEESSSRYTSSRYTSGPNSVQPTPRGSHPSFNETNALRKGAVSSSNTNSLMPTRRNADMKMSETSSYKTAFTDAAHQDTPIVKPKPRISAPSADDVSSVAISETPSFKQREAELKSIEQRFANSRIGRENSSPAVSKFHEHFDEPRTSSARQSLLSLFHLAVPKKAKASTKHENREQEEGNSNRRFSRLKPGDWNFRKGGSDTSRLTPVGQTPVNESASDIWQRMFVREAELRGSQGKGSSPSPVAGPTSHRAELSQNTAASQAPISVREATPCPSTAHSTGYKTAEYFRGWMNQLGAKGIQPRGVTASLGSGRLEQGITTPPKSWSRWPSHTRQARSSSAGPRDGVITRDFATRQDPNLEGELSSAVSPMTTSTTNLSTIPRTLSSQFGKAWKDGLGKIGLAKEDSANSHSASSRKAPKNQQLEYPELELLPTREGFKELEALEREIEELKRASYTEESGSRVSSADHAKSSQLTARVVSEVHQLHRHEESSSPPPPSVHTSPPSIHSFSANRAPALPSVTAPELSPSPRFDSGDTTFDTSQSQISYDDCIPKHMLDEGTTTDAHPQASGTPVMRQASSESVIGGQSILSSPAEDGQSDQKQAENKEPTEAEMTDAGHLGEGEGDQERTQVGHEENASNQTGK